MLEIDAADLGEGVDEPVVHARRGGRQEEEHRLRPDVREHAGAPEAVVARVAPPVLENEPAHREGHVEEPVADVEPVQQARMTEKRALESRLDVDREAFFRGDHSIRVWDWTAGKLVCEWGVGSLVGSLAWRPDGGGIAAGDKQGRVLLGRVMNL